jgi:hypothetical protein
VVTDRSDPYRQESRTYSLGTDMPGTRFECTNSHCKNGGIDVIEVTQVLDRMVRTREPEETLDTYCKERVGRRASSDLCARTYSVKVSVKYKDPPAGGDNAA